METVGLKFSSQNSSSYIFDDIFRKYMKNDYVTLVMVFWNLKSYPSKIDLKISFDQFFSELTYYYILHIQNFNFSILHDKKQRFLKKLRKIRDCENFQKKTLQPTTVLKLDRLPNRITVSLAVLISYPYEHIGLNKVV